MLAPTTPDDRAGVLGAALAARPAHVCNDSPEGSVALCSEAKMDSAVSKTHSSDEGLS